MKPYNRSDLQTNRGLLNELSSYVNVYSFAANDIKVVSVPNGAQACAFSSTGHFFVNFNGFLASGSARSDGSGDELNPTTRILDSSTSSFSIFCPAITTMSVAFYGLQ